jgi:hypothetical protein
MLVDDRGAAGIYDLSGGTLRFISGVRGRDFRVILGPNQEHLALFFQRRRMLQAQEITNQIRERRTDQEFGCIEQLHGELIVLGYEHQSLALRAEAARQDDDIVSELKYSKQAAAFVAEADQGAYGFLVRYLTLLESVWQMPAAHDLCRRLSHQHPSEGLQQRAARLGEYVTAMESGDYVIESELPLRVLVQSADIVGTRFRGRYLLRQDQPLSTGVPRVTASLLISEYQQLCMEYRGVGLPSVKETVLRWLSGGRPERVSVVLFEGGQGNPVTGLEFGLKLYDAGLQTVLVPVALFNAAAGPDFSSPQEYNRYVSKQLDTLEAQIAWTGWLRSVKALAYLAARIVINKNHPRMGQPIGVDYAPIATPELAREEPGLSPRVFDDAHRANHRAW